MTPEERTGRHLERARELLGRPPGLGLRGWLDDPRVQLGRACDRLVLRAMQRVFRGGHRRSVARSGGDVQRLAGAWAEQSEEAARDPLAFFPRPGAPEIVAKRKRSIRGGWIENLRFASGYAAERASAARMLERHPENAVAYARCYRHAEPGRPAIVWLHGWGMGSYRVERAAFPVEELYERGLDVYLYTQPYHAARRPAGVRFAGAFHPSTHITRTNEAFLQTAWEVRALAAHQRRTTGGETGVIGWSLGGYGAALLASVAPEIAFAVPIMPFADLPAMLWSWGEGTKERRQAEAAGITFDEFCSSMAVHAPLAHELAIPRERLLLVGARGDEIIPPIHTSALHRHWGEPELHWFPGSHVVHFGRRGYIERIVDFLGRMGVLR